MILKTGKQLEKELIAEYGNIEKFIEEHEEYEFEKETLEEIFSGKEFLNALEYSDLVLIFDSNLRIENDIENNVELEYWMIFLSIQLEKRETIMSNLKLEKFKG